MFRNIHEQEARMAEKKQAGCARPTGGPVGGDAPVEVAFQHPLQPSGGPNMIQVGKAAPDFLAPAYFNGDFSTVQLSDYLGKWVVLCFYPGDFTFV